MTMQHLRCYNCLLLQNSLSSPLYIDNLGLLLLYCASSLLGFQPIQFTLMYSVAICIVGPYQSMATNNYQPIHQINNYYYNYYYCNHSYIKILESDWSSAGLISAVIGQLHTSCACNWTVVRVMPE